MGKTLAPSDAVVNTPADVNLAKGCGQVLTYQCFRDGQHIVRCIVQASERKAESGD